MAGLLQYQFLCGKQAPVARNDAVFAIQQDRIGESEFPDAGGDLADLLLGMGPGIPGEWNQGIERPIIDPKAGWEPFSDPFGGGILEPFGGCLEASGRADFAPRRPQTR